MGAKESKRPDVTPLQMSEAQVQRLLEAKIKEYERKCQAEALITVQRKLQEEVASNNAQRKLQEEAFITAQRKLQEEAATLAAQRKLQEQEFIAAKIKLQEEAAIVAKQRKLQEDAIIVAQRKFQEEVFFNTQRKLQEEAAIALQNKLQEEESKRKRQEEVAKRLRQEAAKRIQQEATNRAFQEEAAKKKQQEEAAKKKQQEEDAEKKQQEEAAKKKQQEEDAEKKQQEQAAERAYQKEAAKIKQQLEAAKKAFQEEAAEKKEPQEEVANRAFQVFLEGSLSAFQEAAKKKQQEAAATRSRELPREAGDLRYCATCYRRSTMKMFNCENGHGFCNYCMITGRACGICRSNLNNRRSYDIQNHVAQKKVPCPHARQGCKLLIKIADMENHVQECPFKEQVCPLAEFGICRWFGDISKLSSHCAIMHPYLIHKVDSEMHLRDTLMDFRYIALVELGYHFIFHLKISKNDSKVYMAVQLIGTKMSAKKWLYEIHVYDKTENRRKYMYTDNCRSSIDDMEDVFKLGECAVLPVWYANTFFNKTLTYKFFIKRIEENRRGFDGNQRDREYSEEKAFLY